MGATRFPVLILLVISGLLSWTSPALSEEVGNFTQVVNQVDHLKKGSEPAVPAQVRSGMQYAPGNRPWRWSSSWTIPP